jgi:hypothetical protein
MTRNPADHPRRHTPRHSTRTAIGDLRTRRKRVLSAFSGALALSLILGVVPALRAFWTISILLAVALTAYLVLLARFTAAETSAGRPRRDWRDDSVNAPEDWVSPKLDGTGTLDQGASRAPWVRLLVEEQSA